MTAQLQGGKHLDQRLAGHKIFELLCNACELFCARDLKLQVPALETGRPDHQQGKESGINQQFNYLYITG